jgi:hypothetical protein
VASPSLSADKRKTTESPTEAVATKVVNDGSQVLRMWQNGPLRRFCSGNVRPNSLFMPYESKTLKGFAGCYVCAACLKSCDGVYQVGADWLGGCCRQVVMQKRGTA